MPHPLLQRAQRHAGGGHLRPERVAQVMEPLLTDAGSPAVALEALEQLGAVERLAGVRVREDEVVVGSVGGLPVQIVERVCDAGGKRHSAARALGLRRAELAAHVVAADARLLDQPVDVAPA